MSGHVRLCRDFFRDELRSSFPEEVRHYEIFKFLAYYPQATIRNANRCALKAQNTKLSKMVEMSEDVMTISETVEARPEYTLRELVSSCPIVYTCQLFLIF